MPHTSRRESASNPADDGPVLPPGILELMAMPPARRNAILTLIDFITGQPKEELALVAKAVQPHLTDEEVAELCGVSRRTIYNWDRFQNFKPRLADYLEKRRQQFYLMDDPDA
jgi:hypothetical protein